MLQEKRGIYVSIYGQDRREEREERGERRGEQPHTSGGNES
jgi:hypothetical protein